MAFLFTAISILVSISALLYSWNRDRRLKQKEYADRVRRAASHIIAKLERWRELSLRFFDDIQPLLTDADGLLLKDRDAIVVRDFLWRGLVVARADSSRRILDEQIEIAYADLYGYDAAVRDLFTRAIALLKEVDEDIFNEVLTRTQKSVLSLKGAEKETVSATLGNALRHSAGRLNVRLARLLDAIVAVFRNEMIKLIEATDSEIVSKSVKINDSNDVFKKVESRQRELSDFAKLFDNISEWQLDSDVAIARKGFRFLPNPREPNACRMMRSFIQHNSDPIRFVDPQQLKGIIQFDQDVLGGIPVFVGTHIPLQNLVDHLESGGSVEDFLQAFPNVKAEHVNAIIDISKRTIIGSA